MEEVKRRGRVKKGQLRRWEIEGYPFNGELFVTVGARVARGHRREGLGWSNAYRGEILWTIIESDGSLTEDVSQTTIFDHSRAIG